MDIERLRQDTPAVENLIHFDNAGSALPPSCVVDAMKTHLDLEAEIGGYRAIEQQDEAFENTYRALARMLNCDASEIALIENATRAWDMVFYGYAATLQEGDKILTAEAEYASNYLAFLQVARQRGLVIEHVPSGADGSLDVSALESRIDERTKLIAVTHVPTNGGLINPAAEIGRVARAAGIPYILDACQSVGQMPLDVEQIGCDFLSATGRKYLRGPRGTGFLYARKEWIERIEPAFIDMFAAVWTGPESYDIRADARRFENFEKAFAGNIALGVAVDYALAVGLDEIETRVQVLAARLRDGLAAVDGVRVTDIGARKSGLCTFTVDGRAAADVRRQLWNRRINSTVSVRSSTYLDMTARDLEEIVRTSVHYYNTEDEVDRTVAAVAEIAGD